ncbi:MAG: hypothetical protein EBR88_03495 [Betaproteobacteria bacterium]|nr:hypothetical protein [Betaproteobacteria bacterium]
MSEPFNVGDVIGRLTVTCLKPFTCQCECGSVVMRYRPWTLRNGVKSCGCLHRGPNYQATVWRRAKYRPIECITPTEKHGGRIWKAACLGCDREYQLTEKALYSAAQKPHRRGCYGCYRDRVVTPRIMKRVERAARKDSSQ